MRRWLGLLCCQVVSVCGLAVLHSETAAAQSGYLNPGDIVVTCVNTKSTGVDTNFIQVIPLVDLPPLSDQKYRLQYTDLEADKDGVFNEDENILDIPLTGGRGAGQPTMYATNGLIGPDEQVFLFQGFLDFDVSVSPGLLLWGFQMSTAGGWPDQPVDEVSALPTALIGASVAVKTDGHVLFAYTGPTSGTRAQLQALIGDPSNWTGDVACPTGLNVLQPMDASPDVDAADAGQIDREGDSPDTGDVGSDGSGGSPGLGGNGAGGSGGAPGVGGSGGAPGAGGMGTGGLGMGGAAGALDAGSGGGGAMDAGPDIRMTATSSGGASGGVGGMGGRAGAGGFVADAAVAHDAADAGSTPTPSKSGCGCDVADQSIAVLDGIAWIVSSVLLLGRRIRRRRG